MGEREGDADGLVLGLSLGLSLGLELGEVDGDTLGLVLGLALGLSLGELVGMFVAHASVTSTVSVADAADDTPKEPVPPACCAVSNASACALDTLPLLQSKDSVTGGIVAPAAMTPFPGTTPSHAGSCVASTVHDAGAPPSFFRSACCAVSTSSPTTAWLTLSLAFASAPHGTSPQRVLPPAAHAVHVWPPDCWSQSEVCAHAAPSTEHVPASAFAHPCEHCPPSTSTSTGAVAPGGQNTASEPQSCGASSSGPMNLPAGHASSGGDACVKHGRSVDVTSKRASGAITKSWCPVVSVRAGICSDRISYDPGNSGFALAPSAGLLTTTCASSKPSLPPMRTPTSFDGCEPRGVHSRISVKSRSSPPPSGKSNSVNGSVVDE